MAPWTPCPERLFLHRGGSRPPGPPIPERSACFKRAILKSFFIRLFEQSFSKALFFIQSRPDPSRPVGSGGRSPPGYGGAGGAGAPPVKEFLPGMAPPSEKDAECVFGGLPKSSFGKRRPLFFGPSRPVPSRGVRGAEATRFTGGSEGAATPQGLAGCA